MSYEAYLLLETISLPDPLMPPGPRYHHKLLILTSPTSSPSSGSGYIYHVTGDLVSPGGMYYETRPFPFPSPSSHPSFHSLQYLGTVDQAAYDKGSVDNVLRTQEPPGKQRSYNLKSARMEQVRGDGTFYEEGEERPRMRKCTEWMVEQALPALWKEGILRRDENDEGDRVACYAEDNVESGIKK